MNPKIKADTIVILRALIMLYEQGQIDEQGLIADVRSLFALQKLRQEIAGDYDKLQFPNLSNN